MNAIRTLTIAAAASAIAVSAPAAAQNYNLNPTYETVSLDTGFTPDPYRISLESGGNIDASALGGGCRGFVANAPDVRLHFRAGRLPLIISVNASADTTLVVNGPDGRWYCDDDGGNGLNPSMRFSNAQSGQYDIWVGTYGSSRLEPAMLNISELYSE